jgi:hypothetical protein
MNSELIDALKVVAKELESNPEYFDIWQKSISTAFTKHLYENLSKIAEESNPGVFLIKIAFIAGGDFLDSIVDGAKTENGWVFRTKK